MDKVDFADVLVRGWSGGSFVARSQTEKFTGGSLSSRTVANEESLGNKVPGRIKIGRQVAYPVRDFAWWIATKMLKDA